MKAGTVGTAELATLAGKPSRPVTPVDPSYHAALAATLAVMTTRLEQTTRRLAFHGYADDARLIERNDELVRQARGRFGT